MNSVSRNAASLCFVLIFGLVLVSGCENPGAVGSDLTEDRADVVIDTFTVNGIDTAQYNWYSGAYAHFSAGQFNDPLFGNLLAVGMIKPELPIADSAVTANATMKMRLIINEDQVYGDLSSPQEFNVYAIDEIWRSRARMLHDDVAFDASRQVASFTIGDEDSVDVVLDSAWVDLYREYASDTTATADSAYKYEVYGLAIVPQNSAKILPFNSNATRFVIETANDTFQVSTGQWAYSLQRGTPDIPPASMSLHSTLENVLNFQLDPASLDIQGVGIARAELVLYENTSALENSLPAGAERANETTAGLYIVNPETTPESITMGNPVVRGSYSEEDNAYHFTITSIIQRILLDGISDDQEFYITFPNNGIIKSSLIYGENAPSERTPKLIITSLINNN